MGNTTTSDEWRATVATVSSFSRFVFPDVESQMAQADEVGGTIIARAVSTIEVRYVNGAHGTEG